MPVDDRPAAPAPAQESLLQTLQGLWRELPGLVNDRIDLMALELKRAGLALLQVVALVVVVAILAVTAWLALWAGVVGGLMALGLHWSLALMVVLVLNVGAAWIAVRRMSKLLPLLQMPATRRHLMLTAPLHPEEEQAQADDKQPRHTAAATKLAATAAQPAAA